jgi:hypothetical protein
MKYVIRDQHKDITSPHTSKKYTSTVFNVRSRRFRFIIKKYTSTVSPWHKREIINTYFSLLDQDSLLPEGEVIFVQFERDSVEYKQNPS